ncbi:peptidase M75, Imelysin [Oleiphilus messinensis]|uniref:Peptidase M75, Imelysin n=1 Tax=Oleiphilus messinensis TaxID=141451 RepID=A0A1Y0I5I2_9GAMM|nr:imelysin family protein [Oleiphilus messinensis]ARU55046.1 peptidase M75, Imelysin [Oleiphilus messinensis]
MNPLKNFQASSIPIPSHLLKSKLPRQGLFYAIVLLVFALVLQPKAWADEPDWKTLNQTLVHNEILPRYQTLAAQSATLKSASEKLCVDLAKSKADNTVSAQLANTRKAFHDTMDAWQAIQHIRFGPIQFSMRNYSMQFWPDVRNHISKQLAMMLNSADPKQLTEDEFHKASVSIKGLPAIERLIFDGDALKRMQEHPFQCALNAKIASYVAQMGAELTQEWQTEMVPAFASTGDDNDYFEDDKAAATQLLKSLVEPIEVIRDFKLKMPSGGGRIDKAKVKRAESWRTQRSLRNIKINVEALYAMFKPATNTISTTPTTEDKKQTVSLASILPEEQATNISQRFHKIFDQVNGQAEPLEVMITNEAGQQALATLSNDLKLLHQDLVLAMQTLDIQLGFNSRDGD